MNAAKPPGQLYQKNGSDWVPFKLIILIQLLLLVTGICCNGAPVLLTPNTIVMARGFDWFSTNWLLLPFLFGLVWILVLLLYLECFST